MTIQTARSQGQEAGQRALDRANRCDPEFSARFMALLRMFAILQGYKPWTAEDLRMWSYGRGFDRVGDARAIGPLIKKAVRDGIIKHHGFAPTVSSRGSVRATYTRA